MKKKLAATLSVVLILGLATLGILAYLMDEDSDVNVMTLGNVDITQHEQQVGENGELEPFEQGKGMYPGVEISKVVTVENTGKSEAFVRTLVAFEVIDSETFDLDYGFDDLGGYDCRAWYGESYEFELNGVKYVAVEFIHRNAVPAGATTGASLTEALLATSCTNEDMEALGGTYEILVLSQAVQTEGFENATEALDTAFGDVTNAKVAEWFGGTEIPTAVATADELATAIADGKDVYLTDDVELTDEVIKVASNDEATIDLAGHKITGQATNSGTSNLIKVSNNASLTISNGTVSFAATEPDVNWGGEGQPAFPGYANNTINNAGTLIIDGATIENCTAPGGASYAIDNYPGANLIVNSGKIDGKGKVAIRMFANSTTVPTDVTINGGVVTGKRAVWIQLPGSNSSQAPFVNLTINGGSLISTTPNEDCAVYSYSYGQSFVNTNVTITGGEFTGVVAFGGGANKATQENVTITGGTFHDGVGRYLADDGWEDINF